VTRPCDVNVRENTSVVAQEVAENASNLEFEATSQKPEVRNMARFVNFWLLASSFWLWSLRFSAGS